MRTIGLRDTWAGLVLVHSSFALPLTIWLLVGFIREILREAEEAASVDGAGTLATLRWVVAPRLAPGIASTALLTFLFSWNEFLDRKSTRLNSSHGSISYAVFCLKKKRR